MSEPMHPRRHQGPRSNGALLKHFLAHPTQTGAVASASASLADRIVDAAALRGAETVVELGPGTGAITERLLPALEPGTTFFAIEINPDFARATRERCPGVEVHEDSATNLRRYLALHGREACDRIVSSLPWASFAANLQDELLDEITAALAPGGRFVTYAYLTGLFLSGGRRFRGELRRRFRRVFHDEIVWKNFPPALVYVALR
ncbi:MAG: methyltransferase domain-containing protein [Acidobacteria bacterium]|nr:MAG: methyltransferase domain-containing protein [Acidobacteriota bacterium]